MRLDEVNEQRAGGVAVRRDALEAGPRAYRARRPVGHECDLVDGPESGRWAGQRDHLRTCETRCAVVRHRVLGIAPQADDDLSEVILSTGRIYGRRRRQA